MRIPPSAGTLVAVPSLLLYDCADSTNALKVRLLLAELGLEVERVEVPLDGPRPEGYDAVHPFGLIPALRVDDDLTITESNTILRYLAEVAGREDLRGGDARGRARVDMVLDSLSLEVRPHLWGLEEVEVYGLEVDPEDLGRRRAALAGALTAFDALLDATGPFALGAEPTLADFALAGRGRYLPRLGLPAEVGPRTRRALAALGARTG